MTITIKDVIGNIDAAELRRRQIATAMKEPDHMKRWLRESGRAWLVFNTTDLIDALPWPLGVDQLMNIVFAYGELRRKVDSGRSETVIEPLSGKKVQIPVYKDETLEVEELDRAIRFLTAQIYQLKPDWSLTDPAL